MVRSLCLGMVEARVTIQGKLYLLGPLSVEEGQAPQLAQLYVHNPHEPAAEAALRRHAHAEEHLASEAAQMNEMLTHVHVHVHGKPYAKAHIYM